MCKYVQQYTEGREEQELPEEAMDSTSVNMDFLPSNSKQR